MRRAKRLQAAVDFMLSYGIAFIVIFIAISVIYKTGILSSAILPVSCSTSPGFSCSQYAINASTGVLTLSFAQATGGPITLNGYACASQANALGDRPQYGNIFVANGLAYYPGNYDPSNALNQINPMQTTSQETLKMNCYNGPGSIARGQVGNAYFGYIWLNYTTPGYGKVVQQVAAITAKYT
ncbi:MAG: hypothetical protein KGH61_02515 [Candidatus Micrarchaeota archaeon]|nr:hypothetical protein [Candidatus Micrarchaeota archaeon]MDE1847799.1 hypothetical protein [Candidatus Micrarchaeota archaeon]MDE1864237.1 hypothetical protein [Candidatus Micrarchaeota archaeon]